MKNSITTIYRFLAMSLMVFIAACGSDDDADLNTAELLIGTWTTSSVDVDASVGSQSLTDYLVDEIGLTAQEAAAQYAIFTAALESEVSGTLTFNSDNTYTSNFGGEGGSGTWALSGDEETLTLTEGSEIIVITINSISSGTLNTSLEDDLLLDLDEDEGTPEEEITIVANVILTK